jgi:hypothetical protein
VSVKFFGQFLFENGVVDRRQLKDAGDLMYWINRRIGELAAKMGYMTRQEVDRIHRAQRSSDMPFGELAIELGLLTREQVEELLAEQSTRQLRLGEALIELGYLEEDRLKQLLERFDADQAAYKPENLRTPDPLRGSTLFGLVLDQVPRIAMRTALLPVKIGAYRDWTAGAGYEYKASISIRAEEVLDLGIAADEGFMKAVAAADEGFMKAVASATRGPEDDELDREALADMLLAFLNILAGGARSSLEDRGKTVEITALRRDELPSAGFAFDFITVTGKGLLIFATR